MIILNNAKWLIFLFVIGTPLFAQSPLSTYCSALRQAPTAQRRLLTANGRQAKLSCSRSAAAGNPGAAIQVVEARLFVHANSQLLAQFDTTSAEFTSGLGSDNTGSLSFTYTNKTLLSQYNVKLLAFVDLDIDATKNGFSNEYGSFVGLSLPLGAPAGAILPNSWEIDEPGFVFGNIYQHLTSGALDNSNAVGLGGSDDVSLALGFLVPEIKANEKFTVTLWLSSTDIAGLLQVDPQSQKRVWFNGYVVSGGATTPTPGGDPCDPCLIQNYFAPRLRR